MKPAPFEYLAPDSVDEALSALAEHGDAAKLLAGGQSLVPMMNFRLVQPGVLIDLNRLSELDYIREVPEGGLQMGAQTRQTTLERDPLVARRVPLLAEALPLIAHPQIRNRGTLGGSLAHADPAAELPVAAVALEAEVLLRSARGTRRLPASQFFLGMFTTALAPDEMVIGMWVPPPPTGSGWAFVEFARRKGDYALVGLAARVDLDGEGVCSGAALVYLNAGDGPLVALEAAEALVGHPEDPGRIAAAARLAAEQEIQPFGNVHASPAYQRHLADVLTRRALGLAFARARSSQPAA